MKPTLQLKEMFFGQYLGQSVFCDSFVGIENVSFQVAYHSPEAISESSYVKLKSIESITDEDAIRVAQLAHQKDFTFVVKRKTEGEFLIHLTKEIDILTYHISINKYCCINCNWHFKSSVDFKEENAKINIGEITNTSAKPIPYIAIVDFLRSKGYALPYNGISVKELVQFGWVVLE
jgi:hypothetical protein